MRVFLALDLPVPARDALARWRDVAIAGRDDVRPVPAGSLHVTLVFLGAQSEAVLSALWACARDAAAGQRAAPTLVARSVVALPRRRPRLFALELGDDGGRAAALHEAVAGGLAAAGLHDREDRPYWPHLTLARMRRGVRAEPWRPAPPPPLGGFTAASLTLYESRASAEGARYRVLERLGLGG